MADIWDQISKLAQRFRQGDHDAVFKYVPQLMKHAKDADSRATLLGMLAGSFQQTRQWEQSLRYASEAINLDPETDFYRTIRVVSLFRMGDLTRAMMEANRTLEKFPNYAMAYYCRSAVYLLAADQSEPQAKPIMLRRATADIDQALLLDPNDATYQEHRQRLTSILGEGVVRAESSIDGWQIAGKLAQVAGQFASGFLG